MENIHQERYLSIKLISVTFLILFSSCQEKREIIDIDLSLGESVFFSDNREIEDQIILFYFEDRNEIRISFDENYSNNPFDVAGFSFILNTNNVKPRPFRINKNNLFRYFVIVDGDQPGYEYESILDSEYYKIHYLDTINRELYIQFGCTFIRKHRNGWRLKDLPYRIDVFGAIHDTY